MSDLIPVRTTALVAGGQALGRLPDGRVVFVWNALPGETVGVRLIKQKHSYAEGIAEEITEPSPVRVAPLEENYLATSPWQIMTFAAENAYKHQITRDIFTQAKIPLPEDFALVSAAPAKATLVPQSLEAESASSGAPENPAGVFHYRNKMEYSFWGDDAGLHLAMFRRGSHGKQVVAGSALAMPSIDTAANTICAQLQALGIRAGDLKTIIVRSAQDGTAAASLYVKRTDFPSLTLPPVLRGLRVYYSNPKSPASVRTTLLQELGSPLLTDVLLGQVFVYDADAFFQVNLPVYEQALQRIKDHLAAPRVVDLYAGVGSIGLNVATAQAILVELDPATANMAGENAARSSIDATVIETPSERVLDCITPDAALIVDPPRAGLHQAVVERILEVQPPRIAYLSCNPVTQARDLAPLLTSYTIDFFEAYNFFPRTPHIEALAILARR